jgi:hypothetical protein
MQQRKKMLVFFTTVMICVTSVGLSISTSKAQNSNPNSRFNALQAFKKVGVSKDTLLNYKKGNELRLNKLASKKAASEDVLATITLSGFLNQDQLLDLVRHHQLKPLRTHGRAVENNGLRATFSLASTSEAPFDKDVLNKMVEEHPESRFMGFTELVVSVPTRNLQALANDSRVFLVDPSADKKLVSNPKGDFMPGLFWRLEDLGMVIP